MLKKLLTDIDAIGIVIGQTSAAHLEFVLKPDLPIFPRIGEFIKLKNPDSFASTKDVLGRIVSIIKRNQLIGKDFSTSGVELLSQIDDLSLLGIEKKQIETTIARLNIIGFRFGQTILRPKFPFSPGSKVYFADSEFLREVFSSPDFARSIELGWIQGHPDVPVFIDIAKSFPRHIAILAMTGAGKSWTLGRIIEQLILKFSNCKIIVLDPHGEYSRMKFVMDNSEFYNYIAPYPEIEEKEQRRYERIQSELASKVKVMIPPHHETIQRLNSEGISSETFVIDPLELEFDALINLIPDLTEPQSSSLGKAYRQLSEKYRAGEKIGNRLRAFINEIEQQGTQWNVKAALKRKLSNLLEQPLFQGIGSPPIIDIINGPGNVFTFELSGENLDVQRVVGGFIGHELLIGRIKKKLQKPVFLIIEEAHNFIPRIKTQFFSSRMIRKIASEGRKFGVGLCVVSQRPSLLSEDILAQCNTHIIQKIVNPKDRKYVQDSCEYVSQNEIEELPGFQRGEAFLFGSAVDIPLLVQIGPRVTQHGGTEQRFDLEWL